MRARALIAAASFAVAVVAVGCGGEDKPKAPTKAQYIARVDRICQRAKPQEREFEMQLAQALQTRNSQQALQQLRQTFDRAVPAQEKVLADIKAQPKPAGAARTGAEDFIRSAEADLQVAREARDAVREKDANAFQQALRRGQARGDETQNVAQRYGFRVCGTD